MDPRLDAICFEPPDPVPFVRAWTWQRQLQQRLLEDPLAPEALLLLQHPPATPWAAVPVRHSWASIRSIRPCPCIASTAGAR